MKRKILISLFIVLILLAAYLLFWPVPFTPAAWTPPEAPKLTGVYEANDRLRQVERLELGTGTGPEDIAVDAAGRIYAAVQDGRILRLQPDGREVTTFADTGGRPLGLRFDARGNLIVCDAYKGLLSLAPDGAITVLSTEANGVPFRFTNDLDIAANGIIYFTDASVKFTQPQYELDILEQQPNGRLLAYNPLSKTTQLVLDQLYFANGVAISPDQSFLLVNETNRYRVRRYWLTGPQQGQAEIFLENLPGFPDGILSNGRDKFWLALPAPRDAVLDTLLPYPFLRRIVIRLPKFMRPAPNHYGLVLGLDLTGQVVENLQDPEGKTYGFITNIIEHDGQLYLGSLTETALGRLPTPR